MAGHSKWSKVKHIKGPLNVKRGVQFSKLVKETTGAARLDGGNSRLRSVVETARAANMPRDNMQRAIKKGTGGIACVHYEETLYEAYAPGGVAMIIKAATDNKNRTAAGLRLIFSKQGGSLAASGSVLYMFHKKGQIIIPRSLSDEDRILELAFDAGAKEFVPEGTHYVVTTPAERLYAVAEVLRSNGIEVDAQRHIYLPDSTVSLVDANVAAQVLHLYETLEDNEDTQNVYSNFDIPEEALAWLPA